MSAATGRFQLEAEIVDKFSRPIRNFQHALNSVGAPKSAEQIRKEFDAVERSVKRATESIAGGMRRALSGLGLVSLSASAGLAAALSAVKSFSMGVGELRSISKETGYTVNAIRTLEAAASRFHIAPDTVRAGLKTFASNLYDFRRQMGSTYSTVLRLAPDLAAALKEASPDKAVEIALDFLSRIKDRQTAARISEVLFGTQDIARFGESGPKRLKEELQDVRKRIGDVNPVDDQKAQAFEEAVRRVNSSVEGLRKTLVTEAAPALTEFAGWADKYIKQNSSQIKDGLRLTFKSIATAARAVNDVVENSVGWDLLIKGIVLSKVADTAGSMLKLGTGFVTLGRSVGAANLAGLTAILAGLASVGYAFAAFKGSGSSDEKSSQKSEPTENGRAIAGAFPSPSATPKTPQDERSATKLSSSIKDGVAKGVARGLEAVAGVGAGSGSGAGGGLGGVSSGGMSMLRNAISRGRGSVSADGITALKPQGAVRSDLRSKAMRVMARLIALGWTPEAAASAVGQFTVEGFDENSGVLYRGGDKGKAHGIGQWHPDRWAQYLVFAQARAKKLGMPFKANDIDAQTDFFDEERKRRSRAEANWHKETDLARGERLGYMYERYGSGTSGKRLGWSQRWLEEWRKGKTAVPEKAEPGSAFKASKDAGYSGEPQSKLPLFVRTQGAPKSTQISVDPGDTFSDAKISKGRN